jgi:hypothetical protein
MDVWTMYVCMRLQRTDESSREPSMKEGYLCLTYRLLQGVDGRRPAAPRGEDGSRLI